MTHFIRNLKIEFKVAFIFLVILLLMMNLGALSVAAIHDIRGNTDTITTNYLPKLVASGTLKDHLQNGVVATHGYIQTGSPDEKKVIASENEKAQDAAKTLLALSQTRTEVDFQTGLEESMNGILDAEKKLIQAYEGNADAATQTNALAELFNQRDLFIDFLDQEVQARIQSDAQHVQKQSNDQLNQTITLVILAALLAVITMLLLFSFVRRSITYPIVHLTRMAENISSGNFSVSVNIDSTDELGMLARTFNAMSHHIQETQGALQTELQKTKELDKQKTEFLSIAAHQLRTPMSGIKWVVQMTLEGDFGTINDEAKMQLQKSMENIERMIALINSLLDVTRLQTQGVAFKLADADIMELVHNAEKDLFQAAEKNGVTISVIPPATPVPTMRLDAERIGMVISNLLDNAVKYTPKGGRVAVGVKPEGDMVQITIADTGYGIPPEEQERIFTKFFRGSNIQTIQADGSGLGLFMVRQIIRGHGGNITFASEVNKGTIFTITLPVAGPPAPQSKPTNPEIPAPTSSPHAQ